MSKAKVDNMTLEQYAAHIMGSIKTAKKARAARKNGKLGGRPKEKKNK